MLTAAMLRLAACFILLSTLTLTGIYSQNILHTDSLILGKSYKFVLYDDTEVTGKLTGRDSLYLRVTSGGGAYRLRKDDIFSVSGNLTGNKFKSILSLGAGTSIYGIGEGGPLKWVGTYALQFAALMPFSESQGLRFEIGYLRYKRDLPDHDYYNSRSMDIFCLKSDFVIGSLLQENEVWLVGSAGIGMNYLYEPSFESSYFSYYDSTYHTDYHNGEGRTSGVITLGGTIGYWFNKRLGFYFDIQFNTLTYGGYFIFWGGMSYLPIRAGLTYTLF